MRAARAMASAFFAAMSETPRPSLESTLLMAAGWEGGFCWALAGAWASCGCPAGPCCCCDDA